MTLDDFQQLCQSQWDRPVHGDITKLWLTGESAVELAVNVLNEPAMKARCASNAAVSPRRDGGVDFTITKITNPVTRTTVLVSAGNPGDTAVVDFGPGAIAEVLAI